MDLAPTELLDLALSCEGMQPEDTSPRAETGEDADARLVADLKAGDHEAFATLVRRHADQMRAVARRYLSSDADADDAVQEALLKAFTCIHQFKEESRLSTWLHRIVVNAALMNRRSRLRKREVFLGEQEVGQGSGGMRVGGASAAASWRSDSSDDGALERSEERRRADRRARAVLEQIGRLPACHREVLELRCVRHVPTQESARTLGVTPAALKTKLHRARRRLHAELGGDESGLD